MTKAGSTGAHHCWEGGYFDHIRACFRLADSFYKGIFEYKPPFSFSSCLYVLYLHDIEKLYYGSSNFNKEEFLVNFLPEKYKFILTDEEKLAIKYIHGEGNDYIKGQRVMNELGAFCHSVDICSARIFYKKEDIINNERC